MTVVRPDTLLDLRDDDPAEVARLQAEARVEAAVETYRAAARELTVRLIELERHWEAEWERDWQQTHEREQLTQWRQHMAPWVEGRRSLWHTVPVWENGRRLGMTLRVPLGTPPSAYPSYVRSVTYPLEGPPIPTPRLPPHHPLLSSHRGIGPS